MQFSVFLSAYYKYFTSFHYYEFRSLIITELNRKKSRTCTSSGEDGGSRYPRSISADKVRRRRRAGRFRFRSIQQHNRHRGNVLRRSPRPHPGRSRLRFFATAVSRGVPPTGPRTGCPVAEGVHPRAQLFARVRFRPLRARTAFGLMRPSDDDDHCCNDRDVTDRDHRDHVKRNRKTVWVANTDTHFFSGDRSVDFRCDYRDSDKQKKNTYSVIGRFLPLFFFFLRTSRPRHGEASHPGYTRNRPRWVPVLCMYQCRVIGFSLREMVKMKIKKTFRKITSHVILLVYPVNTLLSDVKSPTSDVFFTARVQRHDFLLFFFKWKSDDNN